jgi:Transglutaminase-like superfamily
MIRMLCGALIGALITSFLWWQNVDTDPTPEDRAATRAILAPSYQKELDLIRYVQAQVLARSPENRSIPKGQTRELADVMREGRGLCFDRSRAIEKALESLGFETRHVAVYGSLLAALLPGIASHALSEVRTTRGWMLVDSVSLWIGIDANQEPVSADRLSAAGADGIDWPQDQPPINELFEQDFVHVYGLFSRHGQFYPPWTPFPDVNWRELAENFS